MNRHTLALKYIKGHGIEIGAGHAPWNNPNKAGLLYVDRYTRDQLLEHFPADTRENIPETDIVANGFGCLDYEAGCTDLDFIVNSHVLEHTYYPIIALNRWLACLKKGGHLVMAIPDKTECFDRDRTLTPYDTFVLAGKGQKYQEALKAHQYMEWCQKIDHLEGDALRERVMTMILNDDHIHFVVWDEPTARDFFDRYCATSNAKLVEFQKVGHEFFVVLEKP